MAFVGFGLGGALGTLGTPVTSSVLYRYTAVASDTVGVAAAAAPGTTVLITDTFRMQDFVASARAFPLVISETLGIAPDASPLVAVLVRENLGLTEALVPATIRAVGVAEGLNLTGTLVVAHPAVVSEGLGLAEQWVIGAAVVVAEQLGLTATLSSVGTFSVTAQETIRLSASLVRFLGADISETLGFQPAVAVLGKPRASVTENLGLAATPTPTLIIHVAVDETLGIEPEAALQAIFSPTIVEGIEFSIGYLAPDGSFSTWAMNVRNGAVTEYTNYAFNSFARIGNKYVGASADGLYELLGDDDDGTDIVATISGGFMQFGGTHLARLKAAYIAARGEGDFVLKIETAEGQTYNYAVSTRDMRSTKVHMGKGQRARYFAFELTSSGQDFDLDSLEFVPVVVQRRV